MNKRSFLLAVLLVLAQAAQAQEAGRITGAVVEARGNEPLPGVNVVVVGTLYGAVTGVDGRFEVGPMPPGRYTVQVNALGYRTARQQVTVAAGAEAVVAFRLLPPEARLEDAGMVALRWDLLPVAGVDDQDIRELNILDADELLRGLPGVDAARRGALSLHPVLRGLAEHQIGVYVDGARYLPGSPYGIGAPPGYIDARALESIQVVKGPYALTWGAGNLGALWIETRGSAPTPRLRASGTGGYTSNRGAYEAAGAVSGGVADLSYWVEGVYRNGSDYQDGKGRAVPAGFRVGEVRGQAGYRPTPAAHLAVTAGYRDARDLDAPGRLLDARQSRVANVSARFRTTWAAGLLRTLDATAYWNRLDQALDNEHKADARAVRRLVDAEHTLAGGRLAAQLVPAEGWRLDAGGDAYQARYDATLRLPLRGNAIERVLPDARLTAAGVFLGGTRAFERVEASGVVRVDFVRAEADGAGAADTEATLSGAFSVSARLSSIWRLAGGVGSAARSADAVERYADQLPLPGSHLIQAVVGNPSLRPERSTQADVWLEAAYPRLDLRLNAFARRVGDYVTLNKPLPYGDPFPNTPDTLSFRYRNGKATFFGAEATADYALFRQFVTIHARASYLWGRNETTDEPAPGVAPPSAAVGWRLQAPGNLFFLEATLRGAAAQPRVAVSRGEIRTGSYLTADLRLGLSLPRSSYLLLGLDNLTGTAYVNHLNAQDPFSRARLAEPGFTFFARLRLAI